MPFTNKEFPGQLFSTIEEYEEAKRLRQKVENSLTSNKPLVLTATLLPMEKDALERKVASLESQIKGIQAKLVSMTKAGPREVNAEGLKVGTTLEGESKGSTYHLEVLEEGYLCSNGEIYNSLSGAALGVSGNRRSGWKFWKDQNGVSIGDTLGSEVSDANAQQGHA